MYITYNHCHNSSVLFTGEYHVHSHQSVPYSLVAYAQECVLNTSEYRASCYNIQHIAQCVLNTSEYRASCYNIQHIAQCVLNTSEYRASCYNIQHIAQCVFTGTFHTDTQTTASFILHQHQAVPCLCLMLCKASPANPAIIPGAILI